MGKKISANSQEEGNKIKVGPQNDIYVAATFNGNSIQFGDTTIYTPLYSPALLIAKYDSAGNENWASVIECPDSTGGSFSGNLCYGFAVNEFSEAIVTGSFHTPSITFGAYTLVNDVRQQSNLDYYVAKLGAFVCNKTNVSLTDFSTFPNPTTGDLTLQFYIPVCNGSIILTNTLGELVQTEVIDEQSLYSNQNSKIINLKSLPAGIYFVRVQTDAGVTVKKVIKQ